MRTLLAIVILAALGWSTYWYIGASARKEALISWLEERRVDGWIAEASKIRVTGYPNRIDVIVSDLSLADPDSGWMWMAEEFQVLSLSYKPHHIIVAWPGTQTVGTPYELLHLSGDTLRGSVSFEPSTALTLDHSTIEIRNLQIDSDLGWKAHLDSALLSTRQSPEDSAAPFSHDLNIEIDGLTPPAGEIAGVDRASLLPGPMQSARLDATLTFDRPLDRFAVERDNPSLNRLRIGNVSATWGKLDLRGQGDIAADRDGYADGEIKLRARNWRDMVDVAEQSGAFNPSVINAVQAGLDLISVFSGGGDTLTVPLEFGDGNTRLGPVVLGDAPRLHR